MLHAVTEARSLGSVATFRNQTSGVSIGLTRWYVASMFISFFNCDLRNAIQLAKNGLHPFIKKGDICFRSFLTVI
ncbi:hypothetical protein A8H26_22710 [Pluralibacter gergoviae]|nr:hypothetical protein A8H26_22710 [Pluralibacter gergoviae]PHH46439.1 hypothetical protein CRX51_12090 [Pluralibacter gergoviae]